MTAPSTFKFSLRCGAGNTWVEVTSDVLFEEGDIPFTDGRTSQFDGFGPSTLALTLANPAGKYTPNNPLTTLAVPLSEGMGVCMELAGVLTSGTIRTVVLSFPPLESVTHARVRITIDDMLGDAARHALTDLRTALFQAASGFYLWPFTDVAGSPTAAEASGGLPLINDLSFPMTFGVTTSRITAPSVAAFPSTSAAISNLPQQLPAVSMGAATIGAVGMWVYATAADHIAVQTIPRSGSIVPASGFQVASGVPRTLMPGATVIGAALDTTREHYISVTTTSVYAAGNWTFSNTLWVDGVSAGSASATPVAGAATISDSDRSPAAISIGNTSGLGTSYAYRLAFSASRIDEYGVLPATEAVRIAALAATTPEITLDTLPTLSTAILGAADTEGKSTLDALNEVIRAEQGYMWAETTGTLLAPVQKIKIGARNRERPVDYTFAVSEILDPIPFIHSLTNTVSEATANGPETSATYDDATLIPLVGSASTSDSVPLRDYIDLYGYASDRVARGINRGVAIVSITIDATSPLINRWTHLTAIRQGHRLSITGLPSTQLGGYSTWDGFVVGREITSTQDSQTDAPKTFFTFYLSPWSSVAVYDTARYMADGILTLSSTINAAVTSLSIATSTALTKFTTSGADLPVDIEIGSERMTVTGCTSATPQVATVVRGVGGTTAAAHTAGDLIELADDSLYTY